MTARDKGAASDAGASKHDRTFKRAKAWAERQPPEKLAVHFAGLVSLCLMERRALRETVQQFLDSEDDVQELMGDLIRHRAGRRKAVGARWANDPAQLARQAARELWPKAQRHGWTATQLWRALNDQGHAVGPDRARKLLTELRKTGTC